MSQQKVFEMYGDRKDKVLAVRFNQAPPAFDYALYQGEKYTPIERIDAPVKGAIHLRRVTG
ncbi:hypothetical protein [Aerococcus urinae]|uniref:hypothetical protein n=1 Tax=Aerococcus urinae TaxID=1376 RepID=UPI00254D601B|nr:hypothetical protein [Aerococcus urinae]